jgi:hypothetical protein
MQSRKALALGLLFFASNSRGKTRRGKQMGDVAFLVFTLVFFAVAWAYTLGCDRL